MKKAIFVIATIVISLLTSAQTPYSKELEKKAKAGDVEAQIAIGDAYFTGNGVPKDPKKAKDFYKKAAKEGNEKAFDGLVACYSSWDGIEKNPDKVFEYTEEAALAGFPEYQIKYADLLYERFRVNYQQSIVEKAYDNAVKALKQNYAPALFPAFKYAFKSAHFKEAHVISMIADVVDIYTPEQKDEINKLLTSYTVISNGKSEPMLRFYSDKDAMEKAELAAYSFGTPGIDPNDAKAVDKFRSQIFFNIFNIIERNPDNISLYLLNGIEKTKDFRDRANILTPDEIAQAFMNGKYSNQLLSHYEDPTEDFFIPFLTIVSDDVKTQIKKFVHYKYGKTI